MSDSRQIPGTLKVVAALFIVSGVFACIEILFALTRSHVSLNFGVLGIFVGRGLLRLQPGWRTCALVLIWMALILTPILGFSVVAGAGPIVLKLFGRPIGIASPAVALVIAALCFGLALWQYRVLTRSEVADLFKNYVI